MFDYEDLDTDSIEMNKYEIKVEKENEAAKNSHIFMNETVFLHKLKLILV